jgi:hypothetical protein
MISLIGLLTLALLSVAVAASWECRRWEVEAKNTLTEAESWSDWMEWIER